LEDGRGGGEEAMTQETRYRYEKRLRELDEEREALRTYRRIALNIFDATVGLVDEGKGISKEWILSQFRDVMP
jgi:hypothetical protein